MARRLSEAGVRFVEITQGGWDHHNNLHKGLIDRTHSVDQPGQRPCADLEQRGLLDETLVLFGSEFGRLPTAQGPDGRDHQYHGLFHVPRRSRGEERLHLWVLTDEFGIKAVDGRMSIPTIFTHDCSLPLMGLNHEKLTYRYAGRDFRLTDVAGDVTREIFA